MALTDPVAVCNAATNVEAHLVKMLLVDAGVEAFASEDLSPGGQWMFGLLPEIHKPQVWVNRSEINRAGPLLEAYVNQSAARAKARHEANAADGPPIEVVCEDCGKTSQFPSSDRGSVQDCPKCGAYVDVGEIEEGTPWADEDDVQEP